MAERCISVAFCQWPLRDVRMTLVSFQCQLLIRCMQLLFELSIVYASLTQGLANVICIVSVIYVTSNHREMLCLHVVP